MENVISTADFREIFKQLVGGDEDFFANYWRKKTLFVENGLPMFKAFYDSAQFYTDYERLDYHDATLIVDLYKQKRRTKHPTNIESVLSNRADNNSVVLQSLTIPDEIGSLPFQWNWFLSFYHNLCQYCTPGFPFENSPESAVSAVDFFQTNGVTSVGGHYDTGDVFYFLLEGEKEWLVEMEPDMNCTSKLVLEDGFTTSDYRPTREYMNIKLKPGDFLYVPPFTYHRVESKGKSLAVSVGMPAFNEFSFVQYILAKLKDDQASIEPFPSYPSRFPNMEASAKEIRKQRVSKLLEMIERELP